MKSPDFLQPQVYEFYARCFCDSLIAADILGNFLKSVIFWQTSEKHTDLKNLLQPEAKNQERDFLVQEFIFIFWWYVELRQGLKNLTQCENAEYNKYPQA
jgi:hypothetical protein